jgi:hypothetical protein
VEGNEDDEDDAAAGNAASWFKVELMLEEVRTLHFFVGPAGHVYCCEL